LVDVLSAQTGSAGPSKLFDSYRDFEEWQSHTQTFEQLEAGTWVHAPQNLIVNGKAMRVTAIGVSAGFFQMLGASPSLGRDFEDQAAAGGGAVIPSQGCGESNPAPAADAIGAAVTLNGRAATIIGVMPPDFEFYPKQASLWYLITRDSTFTKDPLNSLVIG